MPCTAGEARHWRQWGAFLVHRLPALGLSLAGVLSNPPKNATTALLLPRGRVLAIFPCCGCLSAPGPRQDIAADDGQQPGCQRDEKQGANAANRTSHEVNHVTQEPQTHEHGHGPTGNLHPRHGTLRGIRSLSGVGRRLQNPCRLSGGSPGPCFCPRTANREITHDQMQAHLNSQRGAPSELAPSTMGVPLRADPVFNCRVHSASAPVPRTLTDTNSIDGPLDRGNRQMYWMESEPVPALQCEPSMGASVICAGGAVYAWCPTGNARDCSEMPQE